ncbi:MAG TPA: alpha/beta hydrolase [Hydrogenophaga sp.]|uniref:alpha/beta fold hydrolase n=1 Tax=Hydrogenophaga sp. TaxID=1904254 RepID=UPI002BC54B83|nr:alpha/beta hydrolase [Hydrogenophaga sp.]HMN93632.1 alpha/beta hydrolase [Hydrogenophaga sp.]HMP09527.1 alpha/beta hydrolase [Hydrogenophaga sp.]
MERIDIDGVGLEVAPIHGPSDRAPLLFLHEGLGSVAMWRQRGRLWPQELCEASGRAGWMYSRRGYGASDPVPDVRGAWQDGPVWSRGRHRPDYMHREAERVLPRLMQALGLQAPVLVGHSDGATIALLHAARHPLAGCVAMAPHVMVEAMALQAIELARQAYETGDLRSRLARYHTNPDNAFWQWNDVWLSEAFRDFDIRDTCRDIACPVLVVQGVNDEYGTLEQVAAIVQAVPAARTCVLDDCGHSPHRDQPETLTRQMLHFLAELP